MKRVFFCLPLAAMMAIYGQAPDNTGTNRRDRASGAVTADDQKMTKEDRELAQQIRKAVYEDKSLSTYAHNVKIIVQTGRVTLKGPVRSASEKDIVERKAATIAGAKNVVNQLDIAPEKK